MPREFGRSERMAYHIQRELAALITREISDPRLQNLTISEVRVSRDLTQATVYFTKQNTEKTEKIMEDGCATRYCPVAARRARNYESWIATSSIKANRRVA